MEIYGFVPLGYEGELVKVEVDVRPGIPSIDIVGLPTGAVKEARERIRIAWKNAGFKFPQDRILINLSPADLPKTGGGFDLPMALALLAGVALVPPLEGSFLALGELALDGRLRRVPGVLPAMARAAELGIKHALVPFACLQEAEAISGFQIMASENLAELVAGLTTQCWTTTKGISTLPPAASTQSQSWPGLRFRSESLLPLSVAAAGGHSLLLYGPPGGGKTVAARNLRSLLPPLEPNEAWEVARLKSVRGEENLHYPETPFREPHHATNSAGLVGGGRTWEPGEAALAHRGVLLLDEAPQFSPSFLQTLREPLEDGWLRLARAGRQVSYPSRFQLVMTANACPCGQSGRRTGVCLCGAQTIRRYWDRIGGALMDRIEMRIFMSGEMGDCAVERLEWEKITRRLENAYHRRLARPGREKNAWLAWPEVLVQFVLKPSLRKLFDELTLQEDWSGRGGVSLLRLSRTLADLDDRDHIEEADLLQAVAFRKPQSERYWEN